jgi:very-short-patch-repair endonuclease
MKFLPSPISVEEYDAERTAFLESKNYRVGFWNNEVMNEIDPWKKETKACRTPPYMTP